MDNNIKRFTFEWNNILYSFCEGEFTDLDDWYDEQSEILENDYCWGYITKDIKEAFQMQLNYLYHAIQSKL